MTGRSRFLPGMALCACLLAWLSACSTPAVLRQVLAPRSGKMVHDRVAVVYSSGYQVRLGRLQRLRSADIRKYERIYRALVDKNIFAPDDVFVPEELTPQQLLLVHTADYLESLKNPESVARYLGVPGAEAFGDKALEMRVLRPFRLISGGTLLAARQALDVGIGINIGGGYHHAQPQNGDEFCIYADVPIAIRQLQKDGVIRRALVIDLDARPGNGIVACCADDPDIYTFSMHGEGHQAFTGKRVDGHVELPAGTGDAAYLAQLSLRLPRILASASPDIVFYIAGCDTLAGDPVGHLAMTNAGIAKRDRMVIDACTSRNVPVAMTLGAGYSDDAWKAQYISLREIIAAQRSP